jgi:hypothetical protein
VTDIKTSDLLHALRIARNVPLSILEAILAELDWPAGTEQAVQAVAARTMLTVDEVSVVANLNGNYVRELLDWTEIPSEQLEDGSRMVRLTDVLAYMDGIKKGPWRPVADPLLTGRVAEHVYKRTAIWLTLRAYRDDGGLWAEIMQVPRVRFASGATEAEFQANLVEAALRWKAHGTLGGSDG